MGNHISRAGWPVNTFFGGEYFTCPVYSLGASLVKKEWLLNSPYDEVLDQYGIGDNYGVIAGFPLPLVHVSNKTFVYHHHEPTNRLKSSLQYYRRILALDYYRKIKKSQVRVRKSSLLWSLVGNLSGFIMARDTVMINATVKVLGKIFLAKNPYYKGAKANRKVINPEV